MVLGSCSVPVADCNDTRFGCHTKTAWTLKDFINYWQGGNETDRHAHDGASDGVNKLLYLKDWHFTK